MTEQLENRVTGFLGLCMRAGQLVSGQEACVDTIRREKAAIVLMDAEASDNTKKRMLDTCKSHDVPLYEISAGALGQCIGKDGRMVIALQASGMAKKIKTLLEYEPRLS